MIASQITEPLEQAINGIAGIRTITSESREERSTITVEFTLDSDLSDAANDVRDRVSRAVRDLPVDANPPVVEKADADSSPILFLSLSSDDRSILEVSDLADRIVRERMETIPGVSVGADLRGETLRHAAVDGPGETGRPLADPADVQAALDAPERRSAQRPDRRGDHRAVAAHARPAFHARGFRQPHHQAGKRPADPLQRHRQRRTRAGEPPHRATRAACSIASAWRSSRSPTPTPSPSPTSSTSGSSR